MADDEQGLENLLKKYRAACPDVEAGVNFMPHLWQRIESRRGFWPVFHRFARAGTAASLVLFVVLVLLNAVYEVHPGPVAPTYADALAADHTAETTYYAEAIRIVPVSDNPAAEAENSENR